MAINKDKPTLLEKQAVRPPSGMKADPPDDIDESSILNVAAPTLDEIAHLPQGMLSTYMENADVAHLEKRITLLSRLIIEAVLWKQEGLTKKERADIALNAIRTFEGSKSTLWVEDPNEKNIPKNRESMQKEKERIEARLQRLLKRRSGLQTKTAEIAADALKHVELQKEETNGSN